MSEPSRLSSNLVASITSSVSARTVRKVIVLAIACVALVVVVSNSAMHEAFLQLLSATKQLIASHPIAGPIAFVGSAALSSVMAFVSVGVLVPLAVFTWGEVLAALYLWAGWILGGLLSYALGRFA